MGRAIVAVSITPIGSDTPSVSRFVSAAEAVLRDASDVQHEIGPMFTSIEGELPRIFALIQAMQEAVFAAGALRVSTVIKVDERRDKATSMAHKVAAVREALGRQ